MMRAQYSARLSSTRNRTSQQCRATAHSSPSIPAHWVKVTFKLTRHLPYGAHLSITGGHEAFGNWKPAAGLKLTWSQGHVWQATCDLMSGTKVEYKYVIGNKGGGGGEWQPGANLTITPPVEAAACEQKDSWEGRSSLTTTQPFILIPAMTAKVQDALTVDPLEKLAAEAFAASTTHTQDSQDLAPGPANAGGMDSSEDASSSGPTQRPTANPHPHQTVWDSSGDTLPAWQPAAQQRNGDNGVNPAYGIGGASAFAPDRDAVSSMQSLDGAAFRDLAASNPPSLNGFVLPSTFHVGAINSNGSAPSYMNGANSWAAVSSTDEGSLGIVDGTLPALALSQSPAAIPTRTALGLPAEMSTSAKPAAAGPNGAMPGTVRAVRSGLSVTARPLRCWLGDLSVGELRHELKKRHMDCTGNRTALLQRLIDAGLPW
ncbi:hypothetical protein V8C86DRAFT_2772974 [Haematococcus lacustris]